MSCLKQLLLFTVVISSLVNGLCAAEQIPTNLAHAIADLTSRIEFHERYKHERFAADTIYPAQFVREELFPYFDSSISKSASAPLPNVTINCFLQLSQVVLAFQQNETWPKQMLDAIGKPPSGVLQGSLRWVGEYAECIGIKAGSLEGKYCTLSKPMSPEQAANPFSVELSLGVCVPNQCNKEDIANLINFAIEQIPANITAILPFKLKAIDASYVSCIAPKELDFKASLAITVLAIIVGIVLIGTAVDLFQVAKAHYASPFTYESFSIKDEVINLEERAKPEEPIFWRILTSLSVYTNTLKLFKVTSNSGQLECLNGIRFLSIGWVVLGHTYLLVAGKGENLAFVGQLTKRFSFLTISNAGFSVDSFFLLSGLLTAYVFLKETQKTRLGVGLMIKYYLHRVWRITPPYMIAVMISACLTRYLGEGPLYPEGGFEINYCADTWWTNLLYVNNLVNTDKGLCFAVSWFLANDMQMHLIAPIMLIPFALGRKFIAIGVSVALVITHIVASALVINHYPGTEYGSLSNAAFPLAGLVYFDKVYIKPWCRVGPYAIGILLGYFLVNHKQRPKLNRGVNTVLWAVSLATLAVMLYGIYPNSTEHPIGRVANILYQASSRNIWSLALGFIIYSCIVNGGFVNTFLSWSVWVPLSRLSFALYLIHYTIISYYVSIQEKPIHIQDSSLIFIFLGSISTSLFAAYLLSMFFEVPLIGLEKFVFKRH